MRNVLSRYSPARRGPRPGAKIVAILGMHRSGTSWLAGSLEEAGLELGDVNRAAQHNRKGNRENVAIQQLHEAVLSDNGGSWRRPNWPNRWKRTRRAKLTRLIAGMSAEHATWGFKDPRTLLVFDEWQRQADDLTCVGIYRHPRAVYRSLRARHADFTEDEAFALWRLYNERLIAEHRRAPFPVLRFDVDPAVLRSHAKAVAASLRLDDVDRSEDFFEQELVHNDDARAEDVPPQAVDVWRTLEELWIGRRV